tara:strand:- start:47 stop:265 length:219 start_codon:yes stop_codon:yes gene_type:complete
MIEFDTKLDGYEVDGTSNSGEDKMTFIATLFKVNPSISAALIPVLIASYFLANWLASKAEGKKIRYRDAWLL